MYCLVILTWSLSTERKCARAPSSAHVHARSLIRDVPALVSIVYGWHFLLLLMLLSCLPCTFTTINKRFNAEVTCIPSESSLLQSHIFAGFLCFARLFFSLSLLCNCSFVTCDCNFDCFYAVCIICIFHFYFMFWKFEHAPSIQHALLLKLIQ